MRRPLLPENERTPFTIRQMIEHLARSIQDQADGKSALAVAVYNHYWARAYRDRNGTYPSRHHLLLIGQTGVGKTVMVKAIAGYLKVPIGHTSGWIGRSGL